jgi:hypothetical protein
MRLVWEGFKEFTTMSRKSSNYLQSLETQIALARIDPSLDDDARSVVLDQLTAEYDERSDIYRRLDAIEARLAQL